MFYYINFYILIKILVKIIVSKFNYYNNLIIDRTTYHKKDLMMTDTFYNDNFKSNDNFKHLNNIILVLDRAYYSFDLINFYIHIILIM